ncbi:MAG: fructose-bisphosphate aldolase [Rickettsiales bacterium]|nr:fructose-bisphosphate aldolase [Rickettsiales bacterium]|tara:strand:- start:27520 stop:28425 length:906 start_codon:yes stop_codon:yes gene_type:complete
MTTIVKNILQNYTYETPAVRGRISQLLHQGELAGTGRLMISAVDQGFEHGPIDSFAMQPEAYDPCFHFRFAYENGLSGLAGPLGFLQAGVDMYPGQLPLILKMNSSNKLIDIADPDQAVTASIDDAVQLGCAAIGFTIYPGSNASLSQFQELQELSAEARACGMAVIVWSYPRGNLSTDGETALDTVSYGAHMACLLGAHIVKVKIPSNHFETKKSKQLMMENGDYEELADRISFVKKASFAKRRLVIFSGGATKSDTDLIYEVKAIRAGGGDGSIIGRNIFQRSEAEAKVLMKKLIDLYK